MFKRLNWILPWLVVCGVSFAGAGDKYVNNPDGGNVIIHSYNGGTPVDLATFGSNGSFTLGGPTYGGNNTINGGGLLLAGSGLIQMRPTSGAGSQQQINFLNAPASGRYNFALGNQMVTANHLEFMFSTAADATSFTSASNVGGFMDNTGSWTLGNATTTNGHKIVVNNSAGVINGLTIQGSVSTGAHPLDVGWGSGTVVNGQYQTYNSFGYVSDSGSWTLGSSGGTQTHTVNGTLNTTQGITFAGGTKLSTYSETSVSGNATGPFGTPQAVTVKYIKIGNMVYVNVPSATTTCTSNVAITLPAVPSGFRPAIETVVCGIAVRDNATSQAIPGCVDVLAAGTFFVTKDGTTSSNFTGNGTTTCGIPYQGTISWSVL